MLSNHYEPSYNWENPSKKELWDGNGGKEWNYRPNDAITEIKVHHGKCIDSILFKSKDGDGQMVIGGNMVALVEKRSLPFKLIDRGIIWRR
ncbi:hypothetical protein Q3G72_021113 [Acer saccharum]|nr:hypothetical protein Q3G72_021113 [Acer saccharum]